MYIESHQSCLFQLIVKYCLDLYKPNVFIMKFCFINCIHFIEEFKFYLERVWIVIHRLCNDVYSFDGEKIMLAT
jgi:hypothetical protein